MVRVASTYRAESCPSKDQADESNGVCDGRASRPKRVFTIRHSGVGALKCSRARSASSECLETTAVVDALEAFILELDGGVEGDRVWMTCTCGAMINRDADRD